MSKVDDGGPAFPVVGNPETDRCESGMSLRNWFAGNAPISMGDAYATFDGPRPTYEDVFAVLAKMRFAYADAMIEVSKAGAS